MYVLVLWYIYRHIQWWFVNPGSDNPEISLIRTKSAGTDFRFWTDGRFSNPENSLIRKHRPGTNGSGLTNHHCISFALCFYHSSLSASSGLDCSRQSRDLISIEVQDGNCGLHFMAVTVETAWTRTKKFLETNHNFFKIQQRFWEIALVPVLWIYILIIKM